MSNIFGRLDNPLFSIGSTPTFEILVGTRFVAIVFSLIEMKRSHLDRQKQALLSTKKQMSAKKI